MQNQHSEIDQAAKLQQPLHPNSANSPCVSHSFIDFFDYIYPSKEKEKIVRDLLRRYKCNQTTDVENRILAEAMNKYRLSTEDEADKRAFSVLMLFYFSAPALSAIQIAENFCIAKRTIWKDVSRGVGELSILIFGIDAFSAPKDEAESALSDIIRKRIYNEFGKEV